jgi:hypothetical protein
MSTTIENLSAYGNFKGRDIYGRNVSQMVKGTGSAPVAITQAFYGINSASTATQELSRITTTESAADTKIATVKVGVYSGTALNDVLTLNNAESKVLATKVTLDTDGTYKSSFLKNGSTLEQRFLVDGTPAHDVVLAASSSALRITATNTTLSGNLHTNGTILKDDLAKGTKISLVDDATAPHMDFILGNLSGTPVNALKIEEALVTISQNVQMSSKNILDVPLLQNNTLTHGAKILLNTHATAATQQFYVGNLAGTPVKALELTETAVNVDSVLNVGGTNVMDLMTNSNPWAIDTATVYLKGDYDLVQINTANTFTTALALDVNGSAVIRGNDLSFFDSAQTAPAGYMNAMHYDDILNDLHLRTSIADIGGAPDTIILSTTNGTDDTYLSRLTIAGGLGVQPATFSSNVNLGVGAAPSGTYRFEVTGTSYFSDLVSANANLDLLNHNVVNVNLLTSTVTLAKQAQVTLTSHATAPTMQLQCGALTGTPVVLLTEVLATINPDTVFNADVTVKGNTVNFWDSSATAAIAQLEYVDGTAMHLRSLVSGEDLILQTTGATSNTAADRLIISTGAASTAYFTSSVRLGVGATPTSTYRFECTGTSHFTGDSTMDSNLDMTWGTINNVVTLANDSASGAAMGARVNLVTHATAPLLDFYLGNMAGTPTKVLELALTMATINTAFEAYGDLNMHGNDVINTATVNNASLALGAEIQLVSHATAPAMNFSLGEIGNSPTNILALTPTTFVSSQASTFNSSVQCDTTLHVDSTSTLVGDVTATVVKKDSTGTSAGASAVQLGVGATGLKFSALATTGNVLTATPQFQVTPTTLEANVDINMNTSSINEISNIINNNPASKGSKIAFASGTTPKLDFVLGNLAGTPVTAASVYDTKVDFNVPVNFAAGNVDMTNNLTVHGDLTVSGTTTTVNSTTVSVADIDVVLASNAANMSALDGGGIILGGASITTPPTLLYNTVNDWWNSNVNVNVDTGKKISVAGTGAVLSETGLQFGSDSAAIYLGASQAWKIVISGTELVFQHYDTSAYVNKFAISSA